MTPPIGPMTRPSTRAIGRGWSMPVNVRRPSWIATTLAGVTRIAAAGRENVAVVPLMLSRACAASSGGIPLRYSMPSCSTSRSIARSRPAVCGSARPRSRWLVTLNVPPLSRPETKWPASQCRVCGASPFGHIALNASIGIAPMRPSRRARRVCPAAAIEPNIVTLAGPAVTANSDISARPMSGNAMPRVTNLVIGSGGAPSSSETSLPSIPCPSNFQPATPSWPTIDSTVPLTVAWLAPHRITAGSIERRRVSPE